VIDTDAEPISACVSGSIASRLSLQINCNKTLDTMTSTEASHAHLWSLPDGTGLHAPYGQLVFEPGTGRVCCHLCGRWFVSLGGHLGRHGHNAESYRNLIGLCRSRPLVAETLSRSIATRQRQAYRRSPALRAQLAVGQELSKTGQLTTLAATAHTATPPPELTRLRRAALEAGRATRAAERDRALGHRLSELGFDDLADYLRHACSSGVSLRRIAKTTRLGWARLRREIAALGAVTQVTATG
jgi:hypothetical protein